MTWDTPTPILDAGYGGHKVEILEGPSTSKHWDTGLYLCPESGNSQRIHCSKVP